MRSVFICAHILWVIYAVEAASIPGILLNSAMIVSHVRTMVRLHKDALTTPV